MKTHDREAEDKPHREKVGAIRSHLCSTCQCATNSGLTLTIRRCSSVRIKHNCLFLVSLCIFSTSYPALTNMHSDQTKLNLHFECCFRGINCFTNKSLGRNHDFDFLCSLLTVNGTMSGLGYRSCGPLCLYMWPMEPIENTELCPSRAQRPGC